MTSSRVENSAGRQYVAMGSSFAAGPGVGRRAPGSSRLCGRSDSNYAHLLARARGLTLTDVSCSGATARQVLEGGPFGRPPQVAALRPETKLVTLTAGGNDIYYLRNLLAWSRMDAPSQTPFLWRLLLSRPVPDAAVEHAQEELPSVFGHIAEEVRRRSPQSTLVFVDYATILPDADSPGDRSRVPLSEGHLQLARNIAQRLRDITAQAAAQAGALLVRASEVTRGHDACASNPWTDGYNLPAIPFSGGPVVYHPNAHGMRAIAEALDITLPPTPSL